MREEFKRQGEKGREGFSCKEERGGGGGSGEGR